MSQPGQGQSGFASARRANAQRAAQNQPLPDPEPAPAANNNNQQGQNNQENQNLVPRLNGLLDRLTAFKDPLIQFVRQTEPQFIRALLQKIQEIRTALDSSNNSDAEFNRRIELLRQRSSDTQTQINTLNQRLQEAQNNHRLASEEVARLQQQAEQGRVQMDALENARRDLEITNNNNAVILRDLPNALTRLTNIITELESLTNQQNDNQLLRNDLSAGLNSLNDLVTAKLSAYQNMMNQLPQQGGKRSKGKRTKKYKKMRGGYSYPSAGYEGAQEIVVASSRSAKSKSLRSSSRRQSKRRPRTI